MWAVGADIGQARDSAAIAAVECRAAELHLRHVERVPLGTTYPKLIERIGKVYDVVPAPRDLVIDATGVGKPCLGILPDGGRHTRH